MTELILKLNELREFYGADGIKVYFRDEQNYTIKVVKDGVLIKVFKRQTNRNGNRWDIKK